MSHRPCDHHHSEVILVSPAAREQAAAMFRALGDPARLHLMELLSEGERCVSDLAHRSRQEISTISQRLKVLRSERLISRRREGKHIFYFLADHHVVDLVRSALAHAQEHHSEDLSMSHHDHDCQHHDHQHGSGCGHTAVKHGDHVDYLHDGHLHHQNGEKVEHHKIEVSDQNPARCTPDHNCSSHDHDHVHGPGCGHEAVPHGDHICYLVDGHLHFPHDGHCDDHGPLEVVKK